MASDIRYKVKRQDDPVHVCCDRIGYHKTPRAVSTTSHSKLHDCDIFVKHFPQLRVRILRKYNLPSVVVAGRVDVGTGIKNTDHEYPRLKAIIIRISLTRSEN